MGYMGGNPRNCQQIGGKCQQIGGKYRITCYTSVDNLSASNVKYRFNDI